MIRKAVRQDAAAIAQTYDTLLRHEMLHGSHSNWKLHVYPTIEVPESKIPEGSMYVLEECGEICASMVLNQEQAEEYAAVNWLYPALPQNVLVIHTLCIPPQKAGHGYGGQMVTFAQEYAEKSGRHVIRIDTYAHNEPAKKLYQKHGFRIAGYGEILLQGRIREEQVYLEYQIPSQK